MREDLKKVQQDTADMQPRLLMLNHWHETIDQWRSSVDGKLKLVAMIGVATALITGTKTAFDFVLELIKLTHGAG
jgi:hypothetical protein